MKNTVWLLSCFLGAFALGDASCHVRSTQLCGGAFRVRKEGDRPEELRLLAKSYLSKLGRGPCRLNKSSDDCSSSQQRLRDNLMSDPEPEPPTTQNSVEVTRF